MNGPSSGLTPVPALAGLAPYSARGDNPAAALADLRLSGNEGARPDPGLCAALGGEETAIELLRSYPEADALAARLAARLGVAPERALVTAGADDGLFRACAAMLAPGREAIIPVPTFEMLHRYARLTGATLVTPPWDGRDGAGYPTDAVRAALTPRTALVALVSPNNPTGAVVTRADLRAIAAAAARALIVVDHAYVEFADPEYDLTAEALTLPNALVLRTLSKAYGLAGLRVGLCLGSVELLTWLRSAGAPYAVAGPSLALAAARLDSPTGDAALADFLRQVRRERAALTAALRAAPGATVWPSQANFVFCRFRDLGGATLVRDGLLALGITVRAFTSGPAAGGLRITCPGTEAGLARLLAALAALFQPRGFVADDGLDCEPIGLGPATGGGPTWVLSANPERLAAARAAGDLPIAVVPPGDDPRDWQARGFGLALRSDELPRLAALR